MVLLTLLTSELRAVAAAEGAREERLLRQQRTMRSVVVMMRKQR